MSKSSQESSPITQWTEKVWQELVYTYNAGREGYEAHGVMSEALTDILAATLENLLPKEIDEAYIEATQMPYAYANGYNAAIDQLRQSLKEMKGE